jgi:hypothetical protein
MIGYLQPLRDHLGLDILQTMFLALPLVFIALLIALTIIESLIWWLRMDPEDRAWSSVFWALRSWKAMLLWTLPLWLMPMAMAALTSELIGTGDLWAYLGVVMVAYLLGLPFLVLNAANYGSSGPKLIWRPAWPGGQAVMYGVLFLAVYAAAEFSLNALEEIDGISPMLAAAIDLTILFAALRPTAFCLFVWLNRSILSPAGRGRNGPFSYRTLAALLLLQLRGEMLAFLVVGVPVVSASVLLIFVVPQLEEVLRSSGEVFSPIVLGAIRLARWFGGYGELLAIVFGSWLVMASQARLFNLLGLAGSPRDR